jgi:hypothetical protein
VITITTTTRINSASAHQGNAAVPVGIETTSFPLFAPPS